MSLHLPLDPSPESGPLSHRFFLRDSGKAGAWPRCTDTLMPHMRVSQLEQGVSNSQLVTASCSLAARRWESVLVIQQPGNSRRAQSYLPSCSAVPIKALGPPGREQGLCKMKFASVPNPCSRIIDEPSTLLPPNKKERGADGEWAQGPFHSRGDAWCILVNSFTEMFCSLCAVCFAGVGGGPLRPPY